MTITTHDCFAIFPKRCDICNRLFWLEPYDIYYKEVGIEHYPIKHIKCSKHCRESDGGVIMSCSKCVYNPFHQIIRNGGENICPDAFTAVSAYCGYNQDNRESLSDVQSEGGEKNESD